LLPEVKIEEKRIYDTLLFLFSGNPFWS